MNNNLKPDSLIVLTSRGYISKSKPPKGMSKKACQAVWRLGHGHGETLHSLSIKLELDLENTRKLVRQLVLHNEVEVAAYGYGN